MTKIILYDDVTVLTCSFVFMIQLIDLLMRYKFLKEYSDQSIKIQSIRAREVELAAVREQLKAMGVRRYSIDKLLENMDMLARLTRIFSDENIDASQIENYCHMKSFLNVDVLACFHRSMFLDDTSDM